MIGIKNLLNPEMSIAAPLFTGKKYAWEVIPEIEDFILKTGPELPKDEYENIGNGVWVAKDAKVFPSAYIGRACIIDHGAEIRHCAFIRENAIIGKGTIVGNSVELKNSILFNMVETPHYNYVGDSILGYKSHMGAGSVTSNYKNDGTAVTVNYNGIIYKTGLEKFGAVIGDYSTIGCNCVLNPGTIIGRNTSIYPLSSVRGVLPSDSIYKDKNGIVEKQRE